MSISYQLVAAYLISEILLQTFVFGIHYWFDKYYSLAQSRFFWGVELLLVILANDNCIIFNY